MKIRIPTTFFILLVLAWWLGGIAVSPVGWLKVLACVFPPYAMYELVDRVLVMTGVKP